MAQLWPGREGPGIRYISAMPPSAWQEKTKRHIVLLGSTGSIGRNALSVIDRNPSSFVIEGLACATNIDRLLEQALKYKVPYLAVLNEESAKKLKELLPKGYTPEIFVGPHGYKELASLPSTDTVLSAQVGAAGLSGTLAAVLAGKVVCLANKESLVLAGDLVRHLCRATGASVLPVDSEHFALFDCLAGRGEDADSLILTASGGPFRGFSKEQLKNVKPAMALKHPNWNMGAKITIDSATLMNKALEFIEACHLYGVDPDKVQVLVHPQSIIHSLVSFYDGSQLAQLAVPDMRLPIGSCLLWPRVAKPLVRPLDLATIGKLTFEKVDLEAFPALRLAKHAMQIRSGMSIVLNCADEAAVEIFLKGGCSFLDISHSVEAAMEAQFDRVRRNPRLGQPFSLSAEMMDLTGSALADATWKMVEDIEELSEFARSYVKNYLECN